MFFGVNPAPPDYLETSPTAHRRRPFLEDPSMDNPAPTKPPENPVTADSQKLKQTREAELKRNREIGHLLKGGGFRQHQAKRTMPHVRGR